MATTQLSFFSFSSFFTFTCKWAFIFTCILPSILSTTHAQSGVAPQPVQELGFARVGLKLYVQGGRHVEYDKLSFISTQLHALDLSTNWSTTSPPWQALLPGPRQFFHNAVVTGDNQTLVTIGFNSDDTLFVTKYDILRNTWTETQTIAPSISESRQGIHPVIDPITSLIYIAAGTFLCVLDPSTVQVNQREIPPGILLSRQFGGSVYSAARKSLMYFGGLAPGLVMDPAATHITEYDIASSTWATFPTTGEPPVTRVDFCMAASEDGLTIVVYGGRIPPPTNYTGSFHILDVRTGQWTRGPDGDIRLYMACTIVGDQFLAWGGTNTTDTYKGPPIIFNLSTRSWTNTYIAPEYKQITPTQSGSISGNDSHNSLGPILGGVFGTLAIVALSGIVHFYLKRKQEKAKSNQSPEPERQPLQSWDSGSKPITTKMMSGVQSQQPSEFRVRNPQSAAFGGSAPRHPQDVNAMGIVIPSPQPQQPTTHVIHESMGTLVTEKVGAAPAPPFAMGMQGQPAPGTMMYVPNAGYTPVNVTTAAALPYTAPGSQVFYSTDVNGNMYSSGYQVFEPTAPAYPTNTTYASGYTTIVSDNSAHHSDEGRTSGVVGGADQRTYVPPPL